MSDGKGYSARHLEYNDYYAEGERVVGEWFGRGAELLGLGGAVMTEDFEAVRQGLDPNTKEFLRVRQSADRVAADGTKLAHGAACTISRSRRPGKTVDTVIVSADGMRKELFHVAASRGRENIMVITSDKERLTQTVAQAAARKSASELVRCSPHRGLSIARELVRAAVRVVKTIQERPAQQVVFDRRKEHRHERAFGG